MCQTFCILFKVSCNYVCILALLSSFCVLFLVLQSSVYKHALNAPYPGVTHPISIRVPLVICFL